MLVLTGVAVGSTLFLTGALSEKSEVETGDSAAPADVKRKVVYHNIQPEFVVNFGADKKPRVLMVEIALAAHDTDVFDIVEEHTPELRNNVLNLLTDQDGSTLKGSEGKNVLRARLLGVIQELVDKHANNQTIQDVYFTRFVTQ